MTEVSVCRGPDCLRVPWVRGLCSGHYSQQQRGRPLSPLRAVRRPGEPCPTCDAAGWLLRAGEAFDQVATQLGLKPPSLARHLARHHEPVPAGGWRG